MASQARALPCRLPFIAVAALTGAGAGAGAAGSAIVNDIVLLAAVVGLATTAAIVIGLSVARFQERRRYANKHR